MSNKQTDSGDAELRQELHRNAVYSDFSITGGQSGDIVAVYEDLLIDFIRTREQAAEIRGLDLIENAPRVPVELMSMVLERKKELRQLTQPQKGTDHAK